MLEILAMYSPCAVCVENHIIVFGGKDENDEPLSFHNIWMYNVYTEQWGKHAIPEEKEAPPETLYPGTVVIDADTYMFGGWVCAEEDYTNEVWRLTRTPECCFEWRKGKARRKKQTPSPRRCFVAWEYAGQLWAFGGCGWPLVSYLNDHGDFDDLGRNNQLLCYDPISEDWRNLNPSGTIPEPHFDPVSTTIGDKVWMYGNFLTNQGQICSNLYQFNMASLSWTEIQPEGLKPPCLNLCSLNAVTANQIVLHGCEDVLEESNDTWIFDQSSLSWKEYESNKGYARCNHTGTACLNSGVIIIGGERCIEDDDEFQWYVLSDVFPVRLEPKTLQQLAIQKIHHHRDDLPWKLLPNLLKTRFLFPVVDDGAHE